ncbi:MAG: Fic family protein, partial [Planctomycetota bacterium]|nr:Fic family protein [Planctomycetota bacterium]
AEKLAESLSLLKRIQDEGSTAIRARDLSRTHRERLTRCGFLQEVIKGWYFATNPIDSTGESTSWYSSYWNFCSDYFNARFGDQWCLSPEQSMAIHVGNRTVPTQLQVRALRGSNKPTTMLHGTSVFDVRSNLPPQPDVTVLENLRIYKLSTALVEAVPVYFSRNSIDARAALASISDASEILTHLLNGGRSTIAGRLCGAFRNIGRHQIADDISKAMKSAGYDVRDEDPFGIQSAVVLPTHVVSPWAGRIRLMWHDMRSDIIDHFPLPKAGACDPVEYLKYVEEIYAMDAYHSLSIEGYRVTPELVDRVRSGRWNPDKNADDRAQRDALAARGYFQAFQVVKKSVQVILDGKIADEVAHRDHRDWYRELFAPLVTAGFLNAASLAGYRSGRVYLRGSRHIPVSGEVVNDLMSVFFDLLKEETNAAVRVVLGHFMFVFIHPFMDGNGRVGRFLMNVMLAAGNYPWTVIPVEQRDAYMAALEAASVERNIVPFTQFLGNLVLMALKDYT